MGRPKHMKKKIPSTSYKKSGVDQKKADRLVEWLKESPSSSVSNRRKNGKRHLPFKKAPSEIGSFSSVFPVNFSHLKYPCLVSATDGVGTKLKWAIDFDEYEGVGQDLVAMCVNDLICSGAQPLFFLDYYACGKLDLKQVKSFLTGVKTACQDSECFLVGGETAEMPGMYKKGDFDCAGFAVGVVEKKKILGPHKVKMGDSLIALRSSGFHSNGFSLLRKIFNFKKKKEREEWKDRLLKPTQIYVRCLKPLFSSRALHAVAHITGGGMDNLLRVLPDKCEAQLEDWKFPEVFKEAQDRAKMTKKNFLKTFNGGVGMVLVVSHKKEKEVLKSVNDQEFSAFSLGRVISSKSKKKWTLS